MVDLLEVCKISCGLTQRDLTLCVKVQVEACVGGAGTQLNSHPRTPVDSQPLTLQGVSTMMVVMMMIVVVMIIVHYIGKKPHKLIHTG